ncbi:MAG: dihydrofolate reductase [Candidatus Vogelbacteria bacterium]|nr:dihydrofolate reductase [Candidatus Vogelbacteria bacterium]
MILSLIVAYDKNRVIGHGGNLPWNIPADMRYFRDVTRGKPVIMGRKTHESIGRALPKRANIVVTRQIEYKPAEGCVVARSLEEAVEIAKEAAQEVTASAEGFGESKEVVVIGGGELYRQALPLADKIYATEIEAEFPGDTTFPIIDMEEWQIESEKKQKDADTANLNINFVTLLRKK